LELGSSNWRGLHNEDLPTLYSSPDIVRVDIPWRVRWEVHVARMGEMRNACRIFIGKSSRRRPLGRRRGR